tara:strand:- start:48 stop:428 length:381 start_codon:yes stop_codon:yes gene_type:complete
VNESDLLAYFQSLEDDYNTSLESNDVEKIGQYYSEDWVLLEPQFGIVSKNDFLKVIADKDLIHSSMKKQVISVKVMSDVAIVISRGMNIGKYKSVEFNAENWITNTYHKVDDIWSMVMSQEVPVVC